MRVKILYTKSRGNIDRERIVLKVLKRTDMGQYLIGDTTYFKDNSVSNRLRHVFWFPDKIVEEDDFVVLYTKHGKDSQFRNKSKTTTHRVYWGLDRTVWNKSGDGAVLFLIDDWVSKKILQG